MAAPPTQDLDAAVRQSLALFKNFLDQDHGNNPYAGKITKMINDGKERLVINIDDLRRFDSKLARRVIEEPVDYLPQCINALRDYVRQLNPAYLKEHYDLQVGLEGNFGEYHVTPRGLQANMLNKVVCMEGIITKCYEMRSKVVKSVHYVPKTGQQIERVYSDLTSLSGRRTATVYPRTDDAGNPLVTEFGLSQYDDYQQITMQEMPERAPAGRMPDSLEIILLKDLAGQLKPGDRARIYGVYRALPAKSEGHTSGVFKTVVVALHIHKLTKAGQELNITDTEIVIFNREVNRHTKNKKCGMFAALSRSIAPSIWGQDYVKKAVLAQLLGGVEKNLANGTHLRGDINVLMVGDPSTAKSQVLRFVLHTAPLAIATTGRGSSGVGLTAAVLTDMDTGEKRLEAGAMVLGDRGVVCIDEFDKMSDADRVAIHEVMEQQTVTINKAGIHTTLNARCSVLAAANPIYGQYNPDLTIMENVALPDSLLSRFDLLFIVLDNPNPTHDRAVASQVLRNHQFRAKNEPAGFVNPAFIGDADACVAGTVEDDPDKADDDGRTYAPTTSRKAADKVYSLNFLKKFIHFAKTKRTPALTDAACKYVAEQYAELRKERRPKSLPITARTLECLIRLSTAVARARLGKDVEVEDAKEAVKLLKYALYSEEDVVDDEDLTFEKAGMGQGTKRKTRRSKEDGDKTEDEAESESETEAEEDEREVVDDESEPEPEAPAPRRQRQTKRAAPAPEESASAPKRARQEPSRELTESTQLDFFTRLRKLFDDNDGEPIPETDVYAEFRSDFSNDEIETILTIMDQQNKIMRTEGFIHNI